MSEKTADERRFRLALGAIALAGLALRVLEVLVVRPTRASGDGYVIAGDSLYYHFQANALAKGLGYIIPLGADLRPVTAGSELITPSAAHPPLYSTYLAVWSKLGVDTITGHRLVSCLIGTATIVLVGLLARRLAPAATADRVGLAAAVVAALYPGLWINDVVLLSETTAIFTVTLAVAAGYHFWRSPTWGRAALLGAAIGLAALSRTEALGLLAFLALPLALLATDRSWGRRVGLAALTGVTALLVLAPWLGHNLTRFEEPALLTSSSGVVLSGASCDGSWYGPLTGSYADCFDPTTLSPATRADLCTRIELPADCLADERNVARWCCRCATPGSTTRASPTSPTASRPGPTSAATSGACRSWSRPGSAGCGASTPRSRTPASTATSRTGGGWRRGSASPPTGCSCPSPSWAWCRCAGAVCRSSRSWRWS